jgi:hypothetical protein
MCVIVLQCHVALLAMCKYKRALKCGHCHVLLICELDSQDTRPRRKLGKRLRLASLKDVFRRLRCVFETEHRVQVASHAPNALDETSRKL